MTIAPIVRVVAVQAPPSRAFEIFTRRAGDWWPKGRTIGKHPHVSVTLEPRAGGRWFETDSSGVQTSWGKVLAWEPPDRLLLAWQINSLWTYDPDFETEVEISFSANAVGGTTVTLEHRNLERFGADASARAESLGGGWPTVLAQFVQFAAALPPSQEI